VFRGSRGERGKFFVAARRGEARHYSGDLNDNVSVVTSNLNKRLVFSRGL
jgi:hypothetical protein